MDPDRQPSEVASGRSRTHARRFAWLGAAMIGLAAVLWIGAATLVAYRLKYPPFLEEGTTDVYGMGSPTSAGPIDPKSAFGAEFETIQIPVSTSKRVPGWMIPGKLPAAHITTSCGRAKSFTAPITSAWLTGSPVAV